MISFFLLRKYLTGAHFLSGDHVKRILAEEKDDPSHQSLEKEIPKEDQANVHSLWYSPTMFECLVFTAHGCRTISSKYAKKIFEIAVYKKNWAAPNMIVEDIKLYFQTLLCPEITEILKAKKINVFNLTPWGYNWLLQEYTPAPKPSGLKKYLIKFNITSDTHDACTSKVSKQTDAFASYPLLPFILESGVEPESLRRIQQAIQNKTSLADAISRDFALSPWFVRKLATLTPKNFDPLSFDIDPGEPTSEEIKKYNANYANLDLEHSFSRDTSNTNLSILDVLQFISKVKPEFCPANVSEWSVFRMCLKLARALYPQSVDREEAIRFINSIKGTWNKLDMYSILQADCKDIERDVRNNLVYPLFVHLNWSSSENLQNLLTKSLLWRGRTLNQVLEVSQLWHRNERMIKQRLKDMFPKVQASQEWPALIKDWKANNGYMISALTSREALRNEGNELEHCVGGYANYCIQGNCHILSIRDGQGGDPSTIEVRDNLSNPEGTKKPEFRIYQHRGKRNAPPSVQSQNALDELLQSIKENKTKIDWNSIEAERSKIAVSNVSNSFDTRYPDVAYLADSWPALEEAWKEYKCFLPKRIARKQLYEICDQLESFKYEGNSRFVFE